LLRSKRPKLWMSTARMPRCSGSARMQQPAYHDVPDGSSRDGRAVDKPRRPDGTSGRARVYQLARRTFVCRAADGQHTAAVRSRTGAREA
jgi:hypothetical protein